MQHRYTKLLYSLFDSVLLQGFESERTILVAFTTRMAFPVASPYFRFGGGTRGSFSCSNLSINALIGFVAFFKSVSR